MILVLLMLALVFVGCKKDEEDNGGDNGGVAGPSGDVDTSDVDSNGYQNDRLPKDLSKYEGKTVKLLGWNNEEHQTIPKEDSTADPIKSALWSHWRGIEDRFGITFNTVYTDSEWSAQQTFITAATADNGQYDLIQTQSLFPIVLAEQGYLCNLKNLGYPDLAKTEDGSVAMPWWPDSVDEYSQHGALYFINSNSSAMTISNMAVIFVNTKLIAGKGLSDPVESVVRGTWTVEEMTTIVKAFTAEAVGKTASEKIYGLAVDHASRMDRLYYSCGFRSVVNDANGVGQLAYTSDSQLQAITNGVAAFSEIFQDNAAAVSMGSSSESEDTAPLNEGRAALYLGYMELIRSLQNTEDWTVVPLPMLDYDQMDTVGYVTSYSDYTDMWCMPTTTQDVVLSGMIMEANASSEYRNIAPFYYEQYLQDRYSNYLNGRKCFDILRDSVLYDLGIVGTIPGLDANRPWRQCFEGGYSNKFAELIKAQTTTRELALAEVLEKFAQYKDNGKIVE